MMPPFINKQPDVRKQKQRIYRNIRHIRRQLKNDLLQLKDELIKKLSTCEDIKDDIINNLLKCEKLIKRVKN